MRCVKVCFISLVTTYSIYATHPHLRFVYDWRGKLLDFMGQVSLRDISLRQLREEYQRRMPGLIQAWEREAPLLLAELKSAFNRIFTQHKRTVLVYLCNNWSYGSSRILAVGMRHILDPDPWEGMCSREETFVCTLFHELLHIWIDDHIDNRKSPLLQKYRNESTDTRDHIHLLALQRMIYRNLSRHDMLKFLDHSYRTLSPLSYKRAWSIVEDEGDEAILRDVRISLKS